MNYYLTHDAAGHQIFLLKTADDIDSIEEHIEEGAVAYSPSDKKVSIRICGEWIINGQE